MFGLHAVKGKFKWIADAASDCMDFFGQRVCQIFTAGPKSKLLCKMQGIDEVKGTLYYHSAYKTSLRDSSQDSIKFIAEQFTAAIDGVVTRTCPLVLHIPKAPFSDIEKTLKKLKTVSQDQEVPFLLEHIALVPNEYSLESPLKINNFLKKVGKFATPKEFKFVLDTSHIFVMKENIKTYADALEYLGQLDEKWIGLIHLNGSQFGIDDYRDKHATPCAENDNIWRDMKPKDTGAAAFMKWAHDRNIDVIHEGHDEPVEIVREKTMKFLKGL